MITAAANTTSSGVLAELSSNTNVVSQKLQQVTEEISTGLVSTTFAGLGSGALSALNLQPQIAYNTALSDSIGTATSQMGYTQTALSQISSVAQGIYTQLAANVGTSGASNIDSIASQARDALNEVSSLINTKVGDTYIFAGQDNSNAPVPNAGTIEGTAFYTQIQSAVQGLGANGVMATEASTLSATQSQSVFASTAGQTTAPSVSTGDGPPVVYGLVATQNLTPGAATATTASSPGSTGSYMQDIMRSLATIASLSSAQSGAAGYSTFVQDTATQLNAATQSMTADAGTLGERQTELTATQGSISSTQISLQSQLSGVEDADVASLATTQSLLQTQLETSYKLISNMQNLSLVSYL